MSKITISVIVHNDYTYIGEALATLYRYTQLPFDLIITINSGLSEESEHLRQVFPNAVYTINETSRGFAENHNRIMGTSTTEFVALLNDDITVHPSAIDFLVRYLEEHPDVALVGPRIIGPDGSPQQSAFSDPSLIRMLYAISGLGWLTKHGGLIRRLLENLGIAKHLKIESLNTDGETRTVPVIAGVAMVARRSAFLQAGLMDEATRFYGEEFGWHWRLRKCGWRVVFVSEAAVTHYNTSQDLSGWKLIEHRKAILNYFLLYRAAWQATMIRAAIIVSHSLWAALLLPIQPQRSQAHRQSAWMGLTWGRGIRAIQETEKL